MLTFLTTLIVCSMKKVHENYWCSSIACQEKRTHWILRIFTFTDKNPLYLPHNFNISDFLRVKVIKEYSN